MTPYEFAHALEHAYGEKLEAVVRYGTGNELFCVLREPTPSELARANRIVRKWTRTGNPPPYFFDPTHIETSLDVFPMEFLAIQSQHEVLLGRDPVEGVHIDAANLRHECESELKGKLLHLRSFYARNCHRPRRIAHMLADALPTFLTIFRGALRLFEVTPDADDRVVVEQLAERIPINPQVFLDLIDTHREKGPLPRGDEALRAFERFLTAVETITTAVDRLETAAPEGGTR